MSASAERMKIIQQRLKQRAEEDELNEVRRLTEAGVWDEHALTTWVKIDSYGMLEERIRSHDPPKDADNWIRISDWKLRDELLDKNPQSFAVEWKAEKGRKEATRLVEKAEVILMVSDRDGQLFADGKDYVDVMVGRVPPTLKDGVRVLMKGDGAVEQRFGPKTVVRLTSTTPGEAWSFTLVDPRVWAKVLTVRVRSVRVPPTTQLQPAP